MKRSFTDPGVWTGRLVLSCVLLFSLVILGACSSDSQSSDSRSSQVYFVSEAAIDGGDGTSWENAFAHPYDALEVAQYGDQVWIAEGVYVPLYADGREVMSLGNGVVVLGGFNGSETRAFQRDPSQHITVLDGQGISYHVVIGADEAVLDGFTITGGNADGNTVQSTYGGTFKGGGMFNAGVSPDIRNCVFTGNTAASGGGAMYNEGNHPNIDGCTFEYNMADFGGAVENRESEPEFINTIFRNNESFLSGGAVANFGGAPLFINAVFSGNVSTYIGGGVLSNSSDAVFTNCSFTGNSAETGGGSIGVWEGRAQVKNCILWNNMSSDETEVLNVNGDVTAIYSIVKGGYPGTGNQDASPCFKVEGQWDSDGNWLEGDYELLESSPAVDRGTADGAPGFDVLDNLRPQALAHDIGAYELMGL